MSLDRTFGQRVGLIRDQRGLTQAEVGRRIGLARTSIANIEADRQEPGLTKLRELAAALDTTVGGLLGEVPIPEPPDVSITTSHHVDCAECGRIADDVDPDAARNLRQEHVQSHLRGAA